MNNNAKDFYPYRSIRWALVNEDFSDLTARQIAEVFGKTESCIRSMISQIKADTGFVVEFKRINKSKQEKYGE